MVIRTCIGDKYHLSFYKKYLFLEKVHDLPKGFILTKGAKLIS